MAHMFGIGETELGQKIEDFIMFKQTHGPVAFTLYGKDKTSSVNAKGQIVRQFDEDRHWHCHLGLHPTGDPMIAYRLIDNNHIRIVCITTHYLYFGQREDFIRQHAEEFPKAVKRQPKLKPKS